MLNASQQATKTKIDNFIVSQDTNMADTCTHCGKEHEELPALAFFTPAPYYQLSEEEKQTIATLTKETCIIRREDHTDYFIRAVMPMHLIDACHSFDYGVWVSLSEKSYNDYITGDFDAEPEDVTYFGWLCNIPPQYEDPESIGTNVVVSNNKSRPYVYPHREHMHLPLVRDVYEGITLAEAQSRVTASTKKS